MIDIQKSSIHIKRIKYYSQSNEFLFMSDVFCLLLIIIIIYTFLIYIFDKFIMIILLL